MSIQGLVSDVIWLFTVVLHTAQHLERVYAARAKEKRCTQLQINKFFMMQQRACGVSYFSNRALESAGLFLFFSVFLVFQVRINWECFSLSS